jgi:hypothetical protein
VATCSEGASLCSLLPEGWLNTEQGELRLLIVTIFLLAYSCSRLGCPGQ